MRLAIPRIFVERWSSGLRADPVVVANRVGVVFQEAVFPAAAADAVVVDEEAGGNPTDLSH